MSLAWVRTIDGRVYIVDTVGLQSISSKHSKLSESEYPHATTENTYYGRSYTKQSIHNPNIRSTHAMPHCFNPPVWNLVCPLRVPSTFQEYHSSVTAPAGAPCRDWSRSCCSSLIIEAAAAAGAAAASAAAACSPSACSPAADDAPSAASLLPGSGVRGLSFLGVARGVAFFRGVPFLLLGLASLTAFLVLSGVRPLVVAAGGMMLGRVVLRWAAGCTAKEQN